MEQNPIKDFIILYYNAINKLERPSYLCRETTSKQALLPSCYSQTLQGNEKSQL